ncbi:DUF4437 domain-containing protein [Flammeovirga sp. SJP92]|uniref:DUF4437 domain-containing protein n=1 Tax=Flammeovirga sp. SJP92 TaxID=1775430 RepID=UPI0007880821|nr:DUF4437 domain-containing protein [Flammeovirga sp. SJP92]KXX69799.1 hypothetical protein AVL50_12990 [Flammeovirga sp. SJP92]
MKTFGLSAILGLLIISACTNNSSDKQNEEVKSNAKYETVLASEVEWTHLNPKRGDLAPKAGTLWGDRNSKEATGFLLKPSDGFQSPPHIHNVSYRGVVINGLIHNDDPNAKNMWMPAGSFWTQPKGEVHITSAKGTNTFAYIEIEEGPYLVHPADEAFDSGERPVNIDHSNVVWLDATDITWVESAQNVKTAFLWDEKDSKFSGTMIKIPADFSGEIISNDSFKGIIVSGHFNYKTPNDTESKSLETGSYFGSEGTAIHHISTTTASIIYTRTNSKFKIK